MRGLAVAVLAAGLMAGGAGAQTAPAPALGAGEAGTAPASPILTVDQDRLYATSAWGRRAQAELEARSRALQAENERIAAELEDEDAALTELRKSLPADEFRARADAFDERVQRLRRDRDAAGRALIDDADADRVRFLEAVLPVFTAMMAERGAVVVLDRRTVFLGADSVDVTAAMIARIDAEVGDGSTAEGGAEPAGGGASGTATPSPVPGAGEAEPDDSSPVPSSPLAPSNPLDRLDAPADALPSGTVPPVPSLQGANPTAPPVNAIPGAPPDAPGPSDSGGDGRPLPPPPGAQDVAPAGEAGDVARP